ncbi:hypothetical protein [Asaia sp. HN010]|uniref:hypothetical protein n=1 Tax=Asaia sp. HN010 TaxID=3081233 RepID=UPI0030194002
MSPAGDFITRGELSVVQKDVKNLETQMVEVKASVGVQDGKLNQILINQAASDAKLDKVGSIKHWIGWVLAVSTSSAVVTIASHVSGHLS